MLDGTRKTLAEANKKCCLTLTNLDRNKDEPEASIKDYLCFFFSHFSNKDGRLMVCESINQIRWRFTLSADETEFYKELITPIKLAPYEQTGHYEITLCAIQGDTLYQMQLSLWPNGDISVMKQKVIARYLPVIKDALGDFREDSPARKKDPFNLEAGWNLLKGDEYDKLKPYFAKLFPERKENEDWENRELKRIWYKNELGFFPKAQLLKLDYDVIKNKKNNDDPIESEPLDTGFGIYILAGTDNRYYLLHGSSYPIYDAIEHEDLVINGDTVQNFARFFCSFIHSNGPFNILTQASDLNALTNPSGIRNDEKLIHENLKYDEISLAEIENICKNPALKQIGKRIWRIDATLQYYRYLFNTNLTVDLDYVENNRKSIVSMKNDQPIFTDIRIDNARTILPAFNPNKIKEFDSSIKLFAYFPYGGKGLFTDEKNGEIMIKKWGSG